jgi:hypothetical protein
MSDSTKWCVGDCGDLAAEWPDADVVIFEHGGGSLGIVAEVRPFESPAQTLANARLLAAAGRLQEALENMLGAFDTPVRRLKYPSGFADEAIATARTALASVKDQD